MPADSPPSTRAREQHDVASGRTPRAGTPAPTAPCPAAASACARSGRRAPRGRAPRRRGRASSRPRSGRASSARSRTALPMSGSATLATDEVQVRDAGDEDQRDQDEPGALGSLAGGVLGGPRVGHRGLRCQKRGDRSSPDPDDAERAAGADGLVCATAVDHPKRVRRRRRNRRPDARLRDRAPDSPPSSAIGLRRLARARPDRRQRDAPPARHGARRKRPRARPALGLRISVRPAARPVAPPGWRAARQRGVRGDADERHAHPLPAPRPHPGAVAMAARRDGDERRHARRVRGGGRRGNDRLR